MVSCVDFVFDDKDKVVSDLGNHICAFELSVDKNSSARVESGVGDSCFEQRLKKTPSDSMQLRVERLTAAVRPLEEPTQEGILRQLRSCVTKKVRARFDRQGDEFADFRFG